MNWAVSILTFVGIPGLAPLPWWQMLVIFTYAMVACLVVNDELKVALIRWRIPIKQISPIISVSPFVSETSSINPVKITALDFFAPGVIVLLLQHIAVTIASLSIVRERRSGTMELFRVSPISASEVLLGKYLSYLIFGAFLAAILALLLAYGYWRLFFWTLFRRPRLFPLAITFAICGFHFRQVAALHVS
jgi:ABC-type Na+ efflux pump permease subunit